MVVRGWGLWGPVGGEGGRERDRREVGFKVIKKLTEDLSQNETVQCLDCSGGYRPTKVINLMLLATHREVGTRKRWEIWIEGDLITIFHKSKGPER